MALNADQQQAVLHDGNLMILAPPGSGKTGTLVEKTKHIVLSDPKNVVVLVTFTDASAKEARERIAKSLDVNQLRRVNVATFHKHAIAQLRSAGQLGTILSPAEASGMLKRALKSLGSTIDPFEAEAALQAAKATPDFDPSTVDYMAEYERLKVRLRAIDLQDVTRECVWGMQSKDKAKFVPPLNATHMLCDEYQDVDWNQFYWLMCHAAVGIKVTVVGDDDQSVYGWRSSLGYEAMEAFIEKARPSVINLQVNYRSHSEILEHATCLIRNNSKRMDKALLSAKGPGGSIEICTATEVEDAAEDVASWVMEDAMTLPGAPSDPTADDVKWKIPQGRWGIIGRTNRDLWLVSAQLRLLKIPYNLSAAKAMPPDVLHFCNFLSSLQTGSPMGLEQVFDSLEVGHQSVGRLHDLMGDSFFSIMDGVLPEMGEIPIEDAAKIKEFAQQCAVWRSLLSVEQEGGRVVAYYKRIILGVGDFFMRSIIRNDEVKEDLEAFINLLSKGKGPLNLRVQTFLRPEEKQTSAGVTLCTMHSSKGLEFDNVAVVQCNSGNVPSIKSGSIEEERRLFYVAMTRARKHLRLQYIMSRGASPFLSEIGLNR